MINWEKKFNEQLTWTAELRDCLYEKAEFSHKKNLLELGCRTGELLKEIGIKYNLKLFGIDTDKNKIEYASANLEKNLIDAKLITMNILNNNFEDNFFDVVITYCYFLWEMDLNNILAEIHRILKHNGVFLILGEPDFGGIIEYPDTGLKKELYNSLKNSGADPEIGRKIPQYFSNKFRLVEHFCSSFPWIPSVNKASLLKDLDLYIKNLNTKKFNSVLIIQSIESDKYFLFIPIFGYYLKNL